MLFGLSQLVFLWAMCSQLLRSEVKLEEEIKGVPPFSFPFFLQRAALCNTACSDGSNVHLAYIYRVHKCNNNLPMLPVD